VIIENALNARLINFFNKNKTNEALVNQLGLQYNFGLHQVKGISSNCEAI
jgi:hypothetical protein